MNHRMGVMAAIMMLCFGLVTRGEEVDEPSDPVRVILQRAVEALDESYDSWNFRPEETVDSTTFTINYIASLSTDGRRRLDRVMILHADPNQDRLVTRDEAMRFLEIQLGLRWISNDPLRLENGKVVDFSGFLRADTDQNDEISEQEFVVATWNSKGGKTDFGTLDANGDGSMTLAEYAMRDGPNVHDITSWFQDADRDRDARLSENELVQATPIHRQRLIRSNLAAFDENADQHLSINEFRLSMLGNLNYPWENLPRDEDHDNALSFEEFQFHPRDLFQLQKRFFFHRLDRNRDNRLTQDEFEFEQQKTASLFRISTGGEDFNQVYQSDRFPLIAAPSVSADGQAVLCHLVPPQGEHKAIVMVMSADGGETREICSGLMPSWSPSRGQFTCSRYEGGAGVWIMRSDGNSERRIDDGWGAQWSPDGKYIAYTNDNSIRIYDVENRQSEVVMAKKEHPYRYIRPHLSWSPDSRRLAFRGNLDREVEIGVLSIEKRGDLATQLRRRFRTVDATSGDLTWTSDGQRLLFSMQSPKYGRSLIYQLQVDSEDSPTIYPDGGTATSWQDVCAAPKGDCIFATATN